MYRDQLQLQCIVGNTTFKALFHKLFFRNKNLFYKNK